MSGDTMNARPPTISDVARVARVSRQTVSRVINGKGEISVATRERVESVIKELGYRPSAVARSLALRRSLDIGLIVPDITQPFYPEIVQGVEERAGEAGYNVFLSNVEFDPRRELRALERMRAERMAGAIICGTSLRQEQLTDAVGGSFPFVLVHTGFPGVPGAIVWPGYYSGSLLATEHLITTGRRQIAYLGPSYQNWSDQNKLKGYRQALENAGLQYDPALVFEAPRDYYSGYHALAEIVARCTGIDAILASSDVMALGVLRYAATHGIAVPGDLAVVGFGGTAMSDLVTPSLSTVVVPLYEIGLAAMQQLLNQIDGDVRELPILDQEPELIVRESSGGPVSEPEFVS